jgi:hypothetical protein
MFDDLSIDYHWPENQSLHSTCGEDYEMDLTEFLQGFVAFSSAVMIHQTICYQLGQVSTAGFLVAGNSQYSAVLTVQLNCSDKGISIASIYNHD